MPTYNNPKYLSLPQQVQKNKDDVETLKPKFENLEETFEEFSTMTVDGQIVNEVINARQGEASLGANITKVKSELAETEQQIESTKNKLTTDLRVTQSNPTNFSGAIVTIIDDDARPQFRTVWQPILNDNPDVKIDIAVVKKWTEDGSALSLSELKTLQDQGHGILCHTVDHEASYLITPERAEADYPVAIQWMKDNGLNGYEHLVYPGGISPNAVNIKNVARKHFKYAISTPIAGQFAISPVDNWCIARMNGDTSTLEQLQSAVNTAKENGHWLILMTHSHELLASGSQKMRDFIAYVQSQSVPIMKFEDAVKLRGNAVAIGEYTSGKNLFVGVDGASKGVVTAEQLQQIGTWTPTLVGTTTAGSHTYSTRKGSWVKVGNLVIAIYDINILSAGFDTNMAGYVRITGLPFISRTISKQSVEYNILNLGTNFTNLMASLNAPDDQILMMKMGNGVATAYLNRNDIPEGQTVIFRGQVIYHTT